MSVITKIQATARHDIYSPCNHSHCLLFVALKVKKALLADAIIVLSHLYKKPLKVFLMFGHQLSHNIQTIICIAPTS
jgi:hypothetical protein